MINWILIGILSVVGSIILSVFGNLLTDPIKEFIRKKSESKKSSSEELLEYMLHVEKVTKKPNYAFLYLFEQLFIVLRSIVFGFLSYLLFMAILIVYLLNPNLSHNRKVCLVIIGTLCLVIVVKRLGCSFGLM